MKDKEKIHNYQAKYCSPNICFRKLSTSDILMVSDSDKIVDTWENIFTESTELPLN